MSKRGDNIHRRKDGRWEGRYKKGCTTKGTIQYGSVYGKTYRETKAKLASITTGMVVPNPPRNQDRCFSEILGLWMEHNRIRLKGGTINKYQNLIDTHIAPAIGCVKLSALTSTMINAFLTEKLRSGRKDQKGGLSSSYVRSIMLVISAALKFAVDEQMCLPLKTPICKPAINKKELCILSLATQRKLEAGLVLNLDPIKTGVLISLHTGLRIGEVCALSWDDVDLQTKVIHVRHTVARVRADNIASSHTTKLILDSPKTNASTRDIPISSALLPILQQANKRAVSNFVASERDGFVSPRTFEYRYHCLLKQLGIAPVNYHTLRHTFATRCIEAGVDVKSLSEMLGHSNVGVTLNTYVHSSMEMKRSQLEKLNTLPA